MKEIKHNAKKRANNYCLLTLRQSKTAITRLSMIAIASGLYSHIAEGAGCSRIEGTIPIAIGKAQFTTPIKVKSTDQIGTTIQKVNVDISGRYKCYHSEADASSIMVKIGNGMLATTSASNQSPICQTNIPGIGIRINRPFSGTCTKTFSGTPLKDPDGSGFYLTSYNLNPSMFSVELIKIGEIPASPQPLLGSLYSYITSFPGRPDIGYKFEVAGSVMVSSDIPTCTLSSENRTIDLGTADSTALHNASAPYIPFNIPFSCEPGAKLSNMQMRVDGSGTSASKPGLITPDNTSGAAQNVFVEVTDASQKRVPFKQDFPITLDSSNNLPLNARLFANPGAKIEPGRVTASMTLTLTQQ